MSHDLQIFQQQLGYQFKNEDLLIQALTHKSFSVEKNKSRLHNERLEFLGDSILNFIVAEKLIELWPNEQEGVISKKRSALVNLHKLAELAQNFKLEEHMFFGPGEVKQGNHQNARLQGSCLEALIGAIYMDSDYPTVRGWLLKQFKAADFEMDASAHHGDYKSRLQELTQKHKLGTPLYDLILTTGPSHKPHFLVALLLNKQEKSRAEAPTKKQAEQKAAEIYLNELIKVYHE